MITPIELSMRFRLDDRDDDSDSDSLGIMINESDGNLETPRMLSKTRDECLTEITDSSLQKTESYCSIQKRDSLDEFIREVGLSLDDLFDDKRDDETADTPVMSNRDARKSMMAVSSRRCNSMTDKTSAGVKTKLDSLPEHLKSLLTAFSYVQHGRSRKI